MNKEEFKAFLFCPLLPVFIFFVGMLLFYFVTEIDSSNLAAEFSIALSMATIGLLICYVFLLLLVMPVYFFVRVKYGVSKKIVYLGSASIGSLVMGAVGFLFGADKILGVFTFVAAGGVLGMLSGLVFWFFLPKHQTNIVE